MALPTNGYFQYKPYRKESTEGGWVISLTLTVYIVSQPKDQYIIGFSSSTETGKTKFTKDKCHVLKG